MSLNFPVLPAPGDTYAAPNGITYTWDDTLGSWTGSVGGGSGGTEYWGLAGTTLSPIAAVCDVVIQGLTVGLGGGAIATNTALGCSALVNNSTGDCNVAIGHCALANNTSGARSVGIGFNALCTQSIGLDNVAIGFSALCSNTTGTNNVAIGAFAGLSNYDGGENVAIGLSALQNNVSGRGNIAIGGSGYGAAYLPAFDIIDQNFYISMGSTDTTNAYIQVPWTTVSDARDKTDFAPVPHGLDFVTALKPTAYRFTSNRETKEPNGPVRYGFLAQDILALEGEDNVIIDKGDQNKFRYNSDYLVPVLVNAIQELSSKLESVEAELAALKIQ